MHTRLLLYVCALAAFVYPAAASASTPSAGSVGPTSSSVGWTGLSTVSSPQLQSVIGANNICLELDPSCDSFALTIVPPSVGSYSVKIDIGGYALQDDDLREDFDLFVYAPDGRLAGKSGNGAGEGESVTLSNPPGGTYRVGVLSWFTTPLTTYTATATMNAALTSTDPKTVLWNYDVAAPQAKAEVPLRVVLVGFKPGEIDHAKVLAEIPNSQRPGVLIPRGEGSSGDQTHLFGADTLVNHGRAYYKDSKPFLVPYEYEWKPQVIEAPSAFASGLFAAMKANSNTGDFANSSRRTFIEKYNSERGVHRGVGNQVAPNAPVRFVDGEKVEDWIAANAPTTLGFDFAARGKGAGKNPGYTVFILNTWDSPEAKAQLQPEREYHVFRVQRNDPDTGEYDGPDWARIWGGRYRFMMYDTGAAPNAYESETWGNRNRSAWGSAAYDPPLWEYRANAQRPVTLVNLADGTEQAVSPGETFDKEYLQYAMARTVNQAASFRFLHSYLYEPWPGTGQYWFSDNVWHDQKAELPWASDLSKLYDQETVLRGMRTLTPYFNFQGDATFEYLAEGGTNYTNDQAKLDLAKRRGAIGESAGVPFTAMHTVTMMDYFDTDKSGANGTSRFLRGAPCYTSVPGINVVAEKHYAWYLPVIAAGVATNREGVPWGYLNSVNDLTKSSSADRDPIMAAAHPQAFNGAFTYTAIHEASHYLGLAHPHDSIGATRGPDGKPRYYDGFTWTFNTTAAPTTYSHTEIVYSILDQESIARGHSAYYLKWSDEALAEAGEAFQKAGLTTTDQLSLQAQALRQGAIDNMRKAEKAFSRFDFVRAAYAAQAAWRDAAAYRDLALKLAPGTTELSKGTKLAGAEACLSAQLAK